jgi:hypothetical protein
VLVLATLKTAIFEQRIAGSEEERASLIMLLLFSTLIAREEVNIISKLSVVTFCNEIIGYIWYVQYSPNL